LSLTEAQIQRYSRHVLLPEVGGLGQKRLLESSALIAFTPEGEGAAAVAAAYLVAGGLGGVGWCPVSPGESPVPGSIAGLAGLYDSAGPAASAAALNPDVRFEMVAPSEIEGTTGAASARHDLLILSGRGEALDRAAARFGERGKPVLRGVREGWAGAVLAGPEILNLEDFPPEAAEEPLPAAPSEGVLGAMLASFALRTLLKEEDSVGSTVLARFDLSCDRMKKVSR
jgi:adenylyltransferase/sulfurtransferase